MLPQYLMVSDTGSFAQHTLLYRKPGVVTTVIDSHHYADEIVEELRRLIDEIRGAPVAPLPEDARDAARWHEALAPWEGATWLQLPWFLAETYFYRRLLEAVRYFEPGPWFLLDPFAPQKRESLGEGLEATQRYYEELEATDLETLFTGALSRCLWGNRADLSNINISGSSGGDGDESHRILIDHRQAVWERVSAEQVSRLDWVADNSGPELLADMGLIALLLEHDLVESVHIHLKHQPYFVSDAMPKDYALTRQALEALRHPVCAAQGALLRRAEYEGRLVLDDHWFWTTSRHLTELPPDLAEHLAGADLILLKGDVNYRRLLEDRHWPHTTDLAEVTGYMSAPFVTLRTLKAELMVGLEEGEAARIAAEDADWLVSGKRGVIHLVDPRDG